MLNREQTRAIVSRISSYNIFTTYKVVDGVLWLAAPGGLTNEQKNLARHYTAEIKQYLTTPPPMATCSNGHAVSWQCSQYGVWINRCYSCYREKQQKLLKPASNHLSTYWMQERKDIKV